MFGHQLLLPGARRRPHRLPARPRRQPLASNGSLMTAPGIAQRLKALRARGGRLVVVDPRRTETAAIADRAPLHPPGHATRCCCSAMLHALFDEGRLRPAALPRSRDGLDAAAAAAGALPARARGGRHRHRGRRRSARLARDFAAAPRPSATAASASPRRSSAGLPRGSSTCSTLVTGNLDRAGRRDVHAARRRPRGARARRIGQRGALRQAARSRVRGLPEFGGELPVAVLAEEIADAGRGPDPRAGHLRRQPGAVDAQRRPARPGARRRSSSWSSIDIYLNETTRHAHLILPPTSPLEHDHYDLVFHALAVRNTASYSPPLLPAPAGARTTGRSSSSWLAAARAAAAPATRWPRLGGAAGRDGSTRLLQAGPYGARSGVHARRSACAAAGARRTASTSGRCGLPARAPVHRGPDASTACPRAIPGELERLAAELAVRRRSRCAAADRPAPAAQQQLVDAQQPAPGEGPRPLHPAHAPRRRRRARPARRRSASRVRSRVGAVERRARGDATRCMPGVVSLPHGWGHDRDGHAARRRRAARRRQRQRPDRRALIDAPPATPRSTACRSRYAPRATDAALRRAPSGPGPALR